jgi:nucleoside-diphosphate-sugar epimerase
MRALVTGASGFIGRHVFAALKDTGWDVRGIDITPGHSDVLDCDARQFFMAAETRYDLAVHAAAVEPHRSAIDNSPLTVGAANLELDAGLFQWAARTQPGRVIYLSSSAAYPVELQSRPNLESKAFWARAGTGRRCALYESDIDLYGPKLPDAMYGHLKLMGERLAAAYRQQGGAVTVARPFSGYGEDQDDRFPFGAFRTRALRRDDPFEVWGDGTQVRDWIHVDDLTGAILAAYEHGIDGPVNLATGQPTSFNELAHLFAAEAGYEPEIKHVLDAPRGVAYRVGDPTLLNTFYECKVLLEEGIRRALVGQ